MIGFDSINNSSWNEELVTKNKQLLEMALVVAINIYNKFNYSIYISIKYFFNTYDYKS